MRTSVVPDSIASIAATHQAELTCNSQLTDSIVITLGQVDTKGHHSRSVTVSTIVVWVSTMIGTVTNADMVIEQIMITLAVDTTIDNEIEI